MVPEKGEKMNIRNTIRGKRILLLLTVLLLILGCPAAAKGKTFLAANRITKSTLNQMDLNGVDKVMVVAHPDDETLWGGMHLLNDHYLVICLTNANTRKYGKTRAREFEKVMKKTGSTGIILNYPDYNNHRKVDHWSRYAKKIQEDLMTVLTYRNWVEVATHNPNGEYGHIHHRLTSSLTTKCFKKAKLTGATLKYFGKYHGRKYKGTIYWSKTDIQKKRKILKIYKSQRKKSIRTFAHMTPYENWTIGG